MIQTGRPHLRRLTRWDSLRYSAPSNSSESGTCGFFQKSSSRVQTYVRDHQIVLDVLAPIAAVDSLRRAGRLDLERGGGRWLFAERRSNNNEC